MLEVKRLRLEGGVEIKGNLVDGDPFEIKRLALGGETLIKFPGTELSYDGQGKLVLSVTRVTEFVVAHRDYFQKSFPGEYWEMICGLIDNDIEIVSEVDWETRTITFVQLRGEEGKEDRTVMHSSQLDSHLGGLMPIGIGSGEEDWGVVGIQVDENPTRNRATLGVGDEDKIVWVAHPAQIKLEHLTGVIDIEKIGRLLNGS